MAAAAQTASAAPAWLGRCFVSPTFDALLIGGGLSLAATALVASSPVVQEWLAVDDSAFPWILLVCQFAHFGASTVRLYTKPGARQRWPFLTLGFPLLSLGVLPFAIWQATLLGPHLTKLYLTWSPYHYAAQTYGLSLMYAYRSGCSVGAREKSLWWYVALCPFLLNFLGSSEIGLQWFVPSSWIRSTPFATSTLILAVRALQVLAIATPLLLFAFLWRRGTQLPLISLLILLSNAVWFVFLHPLQAFFVATAAHGLQYLAIAIIFHVRERTAMPGNTHGPLYHALWFYGASVALGYGLFSVLPLGFLSAGFGFVESTLLVAAAINVHHFIVDAFIWRLSGGDANRRVVDAAARG
jgi:hypothetical protein